MKITLYFTIFCLALGSCKLSTDNATQPSEQFFEYDAIDYYQTNVDDIEVIGAYRNRSKSELDSFKSGIILRNIPDSISDLAFIDKLEAVGFKKSIVDESLFQSIDTIFMEKSCSGKVEYACSHFYRDVLIFKKGTKVIGTAKICFSCKAHQIKGTKAHTSLFGQDGDYKTLEKILEPLTKE